MTRRVSQTTPITPTGTTLIVDTTIGLLHCAGLLPLVRLRRYYWFTEQVPEGARAGGRCVDSVLDAVTTINTARSYLVSISQETFKKG